MERARVDSSSIASIGYDPKTRTLEIEFVGGGLYHYLDFPVEELERFVTADSLGRHFNQHIKRGYEFRRIERDDDE